MAESTVPTASAGAAVVVDLSRMVDAPLAARHDTVAGALAPLGLVPSRAVGCCPVRWFRPGESWACTRRAGHVGGHRLRRTLA